MGLPLVGNGHQRKTGSPQRADRHVGAVPQRVEGSGGYRGSSFNHQQSIQTQGPAQDKHQYALGALFQGRAAAQGIFHAGWIYPVHEELDSPALGRSAARRGQNRGSGAVVAGYGFSGRNQGQNQMRDVRLVFTCSPLGILRPQSNFVGDASRRRGQARAEHGRARKRKKATCATGVAGGASQIRSCEPGVPRPALGVPDRGIGNASRRGGSAALDGLRLRECSLLRSTLLLLAPGWPSQGDQDGGVCKALADASGAEECPCRVEGAKPLQHGFRFCVSVHSPEGTKTTGSKCRVEAEDQTCVCEVRSRRRGLAYVPSYRWDVAGRHGRTSAYDSRLPASQQSQRDQQVFASDLEDQASRPGEVGRRNPAHGIIVREQIKPDPVILHPRNRHSCGSSCRLQGSLSVWMVGFLIGPRLDPNSHWVLVECLYLVERYGGDDETRTRDLCRDRAAF